MSYGTNIPEAYRLAGIYAARILKGEKPVDLPVIHSTRLELMLRFRQTGHWSRHGTSAALTPSGHRLRNLLTMWYYYR